jgi:ectoine hydroxylase-related dioxygenase (phytanoyl-CoA dioxygenase family)
MKNFSNQIKQDFEENGYVIIKNFFSKKIISNAKKEIYFCSKALMNKKNKTKFSAKNFDFFIKQSLKINPKFSSKFYDISKKFLSMHDFVFNQKTILLAKFLLKTKNIGILNRAYGYRMDKPNDRKFLTQLHQDYIQNLGSPEGLVFYNSLKNVKNVNGPVIIYEGSHKLGLLNTKISKSKFSKSRSYILDISNSNLKKFKKVKLLIKEGDLAVFDFLLLHHSSFNHSKEIRWSMVSRFFSFDSQTGKQKMFPGGLQESNKFEDIHPEKTILY